MRIASCHLGAGASPAAVRAGRSGDTTMGFTPLEGLVMATRLNAGAASDADVSEPDAQVRTVVVEASEAREIARETSRVLSR